MKIQITSDSTCDLSASLLERFHVATVPLYVIKDGASYRDGVDITPSQIFAHVAAGGALCSTSAVSETDYEEFFARMLKDCDGLVHVTISSKMSACYQNACNAAKRFEHVQIVDSMNLSTAQGLVVLHGAELAQQGTMDERQIAQQMRDIVPKVDASFIPEKLDYLRKGGRCSAVAALGANLLSIKPCIEVHDGAMGVAKKYRGTFEKTLRNYIHERLEGNDTLDLSRLIITHTTVADGVVDMVREEALRYQPFAEVLVTTAQCTISCHCGPNTLGILYIHK